MAATNAGLLNPLGSPREFGTPKTPRTMRMRNVFEAGKTVPVNEPKQPILAGPPPVLLKTLAPADSPQTKASLWNPLHEATPADEYDDYFEHAVGGLENSVKDAGFDRIKKKSNKTECDFYTQLTMTRPELAPEFHGVHLSDGNQWTPYVILENLAVGFQKPQILDVQIGPRHVGSGDAGDTGKVGLRVNGIQRFTESGKHKISKAEGAAISRVHWGATMEDYLKDETMTMRADVARGAVAFLDDVAEWVQTQNGLRLIGSSVILIFEGDTTVDEPKPPVYKLLDFEHVEDGSSNSPDCGYLNGLANLRWMLQRFIDFERLQSFGAAAMGLHKEMAAVSDQLRVNSEHARKLAQVAIKAAPPMSGSSGALQAADMREEAVNQNVQVEQDNSLAALLNAVLVRHGVNAGYDAMVELLKWKVTPMITDRTCLKEILNKYGFDDRAAILDDLMKWKGTESANLRDTRPIVDTNLSAASELPNFRSLLEGGKKVDLVSK